MQYFNKIDKNDRKDSVLLVGKGPSIDRLNLKWINDKQDQFDIMAISETCKLFKQPKFGIHYHIATLKRSDFARYKPEHVLLNTNFFSAKYKDSFLHLDKNIAEKENVYFFDSRHIKLPQIINKQFDIIPTDTLYNFSGSVVGCINFLAGYMEYKTIYYIGFDGGENVGHAEYSERLYYKRKDTKIEGCKIKYAESWQGALAMIKHYPNIVLKPLDRFLLPEKKKEEEVKRLYNVYL